MLKRQKFSFEYPEPMKNLLQETLEALAKNGKNVADVEWVGFLQTLFSGWDRPAAYMDWTDFERLADQYDYEDDYCYSGLPLNLAVVGKDWWLERKEYDGQEEWVFKQYPQRPLNKTSPDSLRTKEEE